jgi:hypothetical protein
MRDDGDAAPEPQPVEEWFSDRGFSIAVSEKGGVFWAGLLNATGRLVAPRYGRGGSPGEAAERARQRYIEEQ